MNLAELLAQHQASPELSAAINSFVRASQDGMASALEETRQKLETLEAAAKKDQHTIELLTF
ncbi:MAG: hypothetical protein WCO47_12190, partial [Methylococcus sp.]